MRTFRLLTADEIECRVSEIARDGSYLKLLLYKTARTDAALLDETLGVLNWTNDYREIDGNLYCGIAVKDGETWVWKWNVGTESNMEAEKGQASDAMKRAGFVWGIGTELYSAPEIRVPKEKFRIKEYGGKLKCYDRFAVEKIAYDERERICGLCIRNETMGKRCFVWTLYAQQPAGRETKEGLGSAS